MFLLCVCSGIHLAVIHSLPDILTQLLALVASDVRLQPVLDEQNSLYQVRYRAARVTIIYTSRGTIESIKI